MTITERAVYLRSIIERMSETLDDSEALESVELFPKWSGDGVAYTVNTRVRYNDVLYKCLQEHTSQYNWTPLSSASLWARVLIPDPEVIPEWVQPDSTNAYMIGDKVTYDGKTWISIIDNNVWQPGVYGWEEVV